MARRVGQDHDALVAERERMERRRQELAESPTWVIRATDPPLFERVWALRYTKELFNEGVKVAEDLDLMATLYEFRIVASFQTCEDERFVAFEFLPPIGSMAVRPENMRGVVAALKRSGYHAECSDHHGKEYRF